MIIICILFLLLISPLLCIVITRSKEHLKLNFNIKHIYNLKHKELSILVKSFLTMLRI